MNILCLMPTYGRTAALLNNSIACFEAQTYPYKHLLIYDDLGILEKTVCRTPNVSIMSSNIRSPSLGEKYNEMLQYAEDAELPYKVVAVWDDDDIYLPNHLTYHMETLVLGSAKWSKPKNIISAYFTPPKEEDASGRFHGSIAIWKNTLRMVNGWINTTRATFDQEMLQKLTTYAPASPTLGTPQYVYRWQTSQAGHCSGLMGDPDWYYKYQPDSRLPIPVLEAQFDVNSMGLYQSLCPPKRTRMEHQTR